MTTQRTKTPRTKVTVAAPTAEAVQENSTVEVSVPMDDKVASEEESKMKVVNKRDASDGVRCRSVTVGGLYMTGMKSQIPYKWYDEGAIVEVEYQDIVAAIRSNSNYVYKPYFIIEDEEILKEYPRVNEIYKKMYSIKELSDVFKLSESSMIGTIKGLPSGVQDSIKTLASKMVMTGELDSVKKIKALDAYFNTNIMLMTGLMGD